MKVVNLRFQKSIFDEFHFIDEILGLTIEFLK